MTILNADYLKKKQDSHIVWLRQLIKTNVDLLKRLKNHAKAGDGIYQARGIAHDLQETNNLIIEQILRAQFVQEERKRHGEV